MDTRCAETNLAPVTWEEHWNRKWLQEGLQPNFIRVTLWCHSSPVRMKISADASFSLLFFSSFFVKKKNKTKRKHSHHRWFMLMCNWVLIKSVSGAHVIVRFQDPPCVSVCVIGCYRCCECMSGLKEWLDRLRHYVV